MVEHFFVWFLGERLAEFIGSFLASASIACFVICLMYMIIKQIATVE